MKFTFNYKLLNEKEELVSAGEALAEIEEENFSIRSKQKDALLVSLRDILKIETQDYVIFLTLISGDKIIISDLGYDYDSFSSMLYDLRNEIILKNMLMQEALKGHSIRAEFACGKEGGKIRGEAEVRIYETALVIIPKASDVIKIPYSFIDKIEIKDYVAELVIDGGIKISLSQMGEDFDYFNKNFSSALTNLSMATQTFLKELSPETGPSILIKAANLMRDGKAVFRKEIESLSPKLWGDFEKKLEIIGVKQEYDFLCSLAQKEKICIGFKKGLMGALTGDYVWFLIPIYNADKTMGGNAVVMEATSKELSGRATYLFRIVSRKDYQKYSIDDLSNAVDALIPQINRAMIEINFRREPIYLPAEKLNDPKYKNYKFAIEKLPELKELRRLFIGRIIHSSREQWEFDVNDILKFNVAAQDDNAKWAKTDITDIDEKGPEPAVLKNEEGEVSVSEEQIEKDNEGEKIVG